MPIAQSIIISIMVVGGVYCLIVTSCLCHKRRACKRGMRIVRDPVLILTVFSMQCFITRSVAPQLIRHMNTVSTLGSRVKIECSSKTPFLPVDWEFASAGSRNFTYIYVNERLTDSLSSRYNIDTDNKTRYDVVINSADAFHAGTYRCTPIAEEFNTRLSYLAELVVVASDPICNTNASTLNGGVVEGDYMRMWCIVNYRGNWIPVMEWSRGNEKTIEDNINNTNSSTTVTSELIAQLMSNENGMTIKCTTILKPAYTTTTVTLKPGETLATNILHYQHSWNFTLRVLYAPRNLKVTPMKSGYEIGDRIECSANGNPTPNYKWVEIETNKTTEGHFLIVQNYMTTNQNNSFRCIAYNTVAGSTRQIDETITFTVKGKYEIPTEQSTTIAIKVVGGVCCLILASCLCHKRGPFKRGLARTEPDIVQDVQINPYAESPKDQPTVRPRAAQGKQTPGAEASGSYSFDEDAAGHFPKQLCSPVYTEVMKKCNGSKNAKEALNSVAAMENSIPSTKNLTGADGTQYMDFATIPDSYPRVLFGSPPRFNKVMAYAAIDHTTITGTDETPYMEVTSVRDQNPRIPTRHPPMFSKVETYASIDHTFDPPPPPLPPKQK